MVRALFFGATAEAVGSRSLEMDAAGRSVEEAFLLLSAEYPSLTRHKLLFSINQRYAGKHELLSDGDEFAVFTAVSGG